MVCHSLGLQGGANGIVIDPQVGDIGYCGFCSRDISLVKRIRDMAAMNVYRVSDISDAVFLWWLVSKSSRAIYLV